MVIPQKNRPNASLDWLHRADIGPFGVRNLKRTLILVLILVDSLAQYNCVFCWRGSILTTILRSSPQNSKHERREPRVCRIPTTQNCLRLSYACLSFATFRHHEVSSFVPFVFNALQIEPSCSLVGTGAIVVVPRHQSQQ